MSLRKIEEYIRFNDFPLALIHIKDQSPMENHDHNFHELVFIVSGEGTHRVGNNEFSLAGGNVFLIPPGHSHGYLETKKLEIYNILFVPPIILGSLLDLEEMAGFQMLFHIDPHLQDDYTTSRVLTIPPEKIIFDIHRLEVSLNSKERGWKFESRMVFEQLLYNIISSFSIESPNTLLGNLGRIIPYIKGNITEDLNLARICNEAAMSRSSLTRSFQQVFQCSPMEKVQQLRIELACGLLKNKTLSVQDVSEQCGFSSTAYFCRVFKKILGETPGEFRKEEEVGTNEKKVTLL